MRTESVKSQMKEERLSVVNRERKTAKFSREVFTEGCKSVFLDLVNNQSALLLYRNLTLWQMQAKCPFYKEVPTLTSLPLQVLPKVSTATRPVTAVTRLTGTWVKTTVFHITPYFDENPEAKSYFCNVGCANWFGRYQTAEEQNNGANFLTEMLTIGAHDFVLELICNFTLHAHMFMKGIREQFWFLLANETDPDILGLLSRACQNSISKMGVDCLRVWKTAIEKGRSSGCGITVAKAFVDFFLLKCVMLWECSDALKGPELFDKLQSLSDEGKLQFFNEIADAMMKSGGSPEPALVGVFGPAPNELWSVLDCYLACDMANYIGKQDPSIRVDSDLVVSKPANLLKEAFVFIPLMAKQLPVPGISKCTLENETPELNDQLKRWLSQCHRGNSDPVFSLPGVVEGRDLTEFESFVVEHEIAELKENKRFLREYREKLTAYTLTVSQLEEINWQTKAVSCSYAGRFPCTKSNGVSDFVKELKAWLLNGVSGFLVDYVARLAPSAKRSNIEKDFKKQLTPGLWTDPVPLELIKNVYMNIVPRYVKSADTFPGELRQFSVVALRFCDLYVHGQIMRKLTSFKVAALATPAVELVPVEMTMLDDIEAVNECMQEPIACISFLLNTIISSQNVCERAWVLLQVVPLIRFLLTKCYSVSLDVDADTPASQFFEALCGTPEQKQKLATALQEVMTALTKLGIPAHLSLPEVRSAVDDVFRWSGVKI